MARAGLVATTLTLLVTAGSLPAASSVPAYGQSAPARALTAAQAELTVSGTVSDGSGHGWPLYARLDVAGVGTFFTDPATGRYSFPAGADTTYQVSVRALYPGYQTRRVDVEVGTEDATADVALPVDGACVAPGYAGAFGKPVLTESFDGPETPAGWRVVDRTATPGWSFTDAANRGNLTGGDGGYAIVDSDARGSGTTVDSDLITPPLDLTGTTAMYLRFNSDFRAVGVDDVAHVDVSVDGGQTWSNVWRATTSRRGPVAEEVALGPASGAASALVRFRYVGSWDWWWQVDNVELLPRGCQPVPGGLVVGVTTDQNTGAGVNGVRVSSVDAPAESAVSAATPDDPNLPDGFYWLFSSVTGDRRFTAAKPPYESLTRTVAVAADRASRLDFSLRAGRLEISPPAVGTYQAYGSVQTADVTFTNTGSAPVTVELSERTGSFNILLNALRQNGARTTTVKVPGGLTKGLKSPPKAPAGRAALTAVPAVDSSWSQIPGFPVDIYDNAAATVNGKIYSVGGHFQSGHENKAFVYDPAANSWSALPNLPTPRIKPQAVSARGLLYVFGGWRPDTALVDTVDVFDPASGQWSTLATRHPQPRAAAGAAVVAGKVYLIGGCRDADCTDSADVVRFDLATGQFSTHRPYPHAASWLACGGIGARVYCAGGTGTVEYADGFTYNPANDTWAPIANMPLDLWASAHTSASGLLVIMGGVTGGSTSVTNRAVAYDPGGNAWIDLPGAAFARFRGAGACGAYKIGGSVGSGGASAASERLGGLDSCNQGAEDVPWLSFAPATFTLAPGARRVLPVRLSATPAAGITQPGKYTANIGVGVQTPYPVSSIPVEMNVLPPANAGKVQGTVRGQPCGGAATGLPATVRFNPVSGAAGGTTLVADGAGAFAAWLPSGEYDAIVAKDGWVPKVTRIRVVNSVITTLDPTLDPVNPC